MNSQWYTNVLEHQDVRQSLIELKKELKEVSNCKVLENQEDYDPGIFVKLLEDEDPKIRKNAVLILGLLEENQYIDEITNAYLEEKTKFIRSDYLRALGYLNYRVKLAELKSRYEEILEKEYPPEDKKHIREELSELQDLIYAVDLPQKHRFITPKRELTVWLTTNRNFRKLTASQLPEGPKKLTAAGVQIRTNNIEAIKKIRTYNELLFVPDGCDVISSKPAEAAKQLMAAGVFDLIKELHEGSGKFFFRLGILGVKDLAKRSILVKDLAAEIEEITDYEFVNSTSDYEIEIRLFQLKDGKFRGALKCQALEDRRFAYRKEVVASSLKPYLAATMVEAARPYLKKDAQILDPFCGVGTLLIERCQAVPAKEIYGIDQFEDTIEKARINSELIGPRNHYINKNYFDFHHEYLFDEIITDMPVRGRMTRPELEEVYEMFFDKSEEVLQPEAVIIMYSNEEELVRKQLKKHERYHMVEVYDVNVKLGTSLYIMEFKG